jgi:hypothetical protein
MLPRSVLFCYDSAQHSDIFKNVKLFFVLLAVSIVAAHGQYDAQARIRWCRQLHRRSIPALGLFDNLKALNKVGAPTKGCEEIQTVGLPDKKNVDHPSDEIPRINSSAW